MIQDIGDLKFDNQYRNQKPKAEDFVFAFSGTNKGNDSLMVTLETEGDMARMELPTWAEIVAQKKDASAIYLFSLEGRPYFLYENFTDEKLEGNYEIIRLFRMAEPMELSFLGMTAYHLFDWYRSSQFCGKCGHKTVHDGKERMMRCEACGNLIFPKICPAVIVAVRNGDKIMMTHYAGREYKGRALLAGFCEIGETPEETVIREVKEEIGVDVTNVTYFASQPWGFDSDLLLGYYCDLAGSSEVTLDEEELAQAAWVPRSEIVYDPNLRSLTATMIEAFRCGEI